MSANTNISDLLQYVILDVPGCPLPVATQKVYLALQDFFKTTQTWRHTSDPVAIRAGVTRYDVDDIPRYTRVSAVVGVAIDDQAKSPDTDFLYDDNEGQLVLVQEPEDDIASGLVITSALYPTTEATQIPTAIYMRYFEGMAHGALWKLMVEPGKPWSNLPLAEYHSRQYDIARQHARHAMLRGTGTNRNVTMRPKHGWL